MDATDLTVRGVRRGNYRVRFFTYDATTRTATWTFATPIANDRVTIRLNGSGPTGIQDASANSLGDWGKSIGVLAGDFDGDGVVTDADARAIRRRFGHGRPIDRFADLTGDGIVDAADYNLALSRRRSRLP